MESTSPDAVRDLGHLALGTRLRRLGERLQAHTQVVLTQAGVTVPASHLPLLVALARGGAMPVGALARTLGATQPGVTRMTAALEAAGLVRSQATAHDRRARVVAVTPAARRLLDRLERDTFPRIAAAVRDACADASGRFLAQLTALEVALDTAPLATRIARPTARRRA